MFAIGDRVIVVDHFEPTVVRGRGTIIGLDKMGEDYYSVLMKPSPRLKRFNHFQKVEHCTKPCILVTCEEGCDIRLAG